MASINPSVAWSKSDEGHVVVDLHDADLALLVANGQPNTRAFLSEREARGLVRGPRLTARPARAKGRVVSGDRLRKLLDACDGVQLSGGDVKLLSHVAASGDAAADDMTALIERLRRGSYPAIDTEGGDGS